MIIRVAPAHPQNNGDNPFPIPSGISVSKAPTKAKIIIATSTIPIISKIFDMFFYPLSRIKKIYGFVK